ncbi:acyl-CoA carboxylase subunit beta [Deinococcus soli (ex Cha et al. 2016)]|uniref:Acetyl-CoA carboxylase carboxyltransferase component n=2 Tax=Deinococcus soli (ex Cha et al. 2016) TaxID=1309411 RepID=A0ACC6KBD6_9DEIO|nr:acyl-CoA carboxylase subunit beta [Deinococcus soli (ex Cha et al. 2016)]MDR6216693.1 acetyl-CoA carboxylase carboxyltransferase component [Deinococcus soli (ex Cha et al. 2016)]MDR6327514.1 acetyl-CoA carboxylase carboxyltransferase component [Deinococcus soli (ex Cha et al. 2016)]MDR6749789.1 acetyl-CoA carboxylase carboxyltransferase component [Deinococcus soli (ex Cha et al. 2016)]
MTQPDTSAPPAPPTRSAWQDALERLATDRLTVHAGGGAKAQQRQHDKNRLTARERIRQLIDDGTPFDELMTFAGWEMYQDVGGCPSGGTVTGIGQIQGRPWMIIANDATVKAGAFFPITAKKVIRAQTIALENHLPVVYLVDSAGVYLPMQDEIFPDQDDFGRVFYLNARMSARGIPQIAAIMGNCVAGGAYLPVMCDTLIMTEGSGLYLAGPALVKAAIGQVVDSEDLGGASMHASIAGTVDYKEPDDAAALNRIRALADLYAQGDLAPFAKRRRETLPAPERDLTDLVGFDGSKTYDVRDLITALVDAGEFHEFKPEYGETLVCGFARAGGYPVAFVANQRTVIKKKLKSGGEPGLRTRIEVGGVIYGDSADKAARFIMDANQAGVPLVFLSDVTGFMVGRDSEQEGIIRRGAKLVNAVSNTVVPKITIITGGSFGAGNYAMNGKAYAPRFLFAWPSAKYAVMSGNAAAKTLLDIQLAALKRSGHQPDDEELQRLYDEVKSKYDTELDPRYAAARLWVDEIIQPNDTRDRLIRALEACAQNPHQDEFRVGVFQV